jgi:hypothetical protein
MNSLKKGRSSTLRRRAIFAVLQCLPVGRSKPAEQGRDGRRELQHIVY